MSLLASQNEKLMLATNSFFLKVTLLFPYPMIGFTKIDINFQYALQKLVFSAYSISMLVKPTTTKF